MNRRNFLKTFGAVAMLAIVSLIIAACSGGTNQGTPSKGSDSASRPKVTIMWSIYVGWMPWPYAEESGILQKWADKYNVDIELKQADYIASIEAYVAGKADGVVMTNMEALTIPAAAGIDTTAIIIGDYSNGNDAVLTRKNLGLCDLTGRDVYLVELSVSQYLLARGLESECAGKVTEKNINLVNSSDSDIGPVFISNSGQEAVVTWNPIVLEIESQVRDVRNAYNSSQIPGEILDIMFLRTNVITKHPEVAKALAGAWYETMALMQGTRPKTEEALRAMAERSGTTVESYKQQLATTYMYWKATDAAAFARDPKLVETMDLVRRFSYDHGLFGQGATSVDDVGIQFPDGTVLGNSKNVKLRFVDTYMK